MFSKNKIKINLLNQMRILQLKAINPDTHNSYRHEALKEIRLIKNRLDLLYMKYRIVVYSICKDEIILSVSCKSSYESSDYFFDVLHYQIGKVIKNYDRLLTNITHDGYINTYKINKDDIEIFKFTVKDVANQLKKGIWLLDNKYQDNDKQYINYVRLDTRNEILI